MADPLQTTALVLDRVPYGDADLVLTLLTRDGGLLSALARSARGSRRRFAGALDLFVVASVVYRPAGTRGTLASLAGAEPSRAFPGIFDNLERLEAGQALLVLARDLLRDAPVTETTFLHVEDALARLADATPEAAHREVLRLAVVLLTDLGHAPAAEPCPVCGDALGAAGEVTVGSDGGLRCGRCAPPGPGRIPAALLDPDGVAPAPAKDDLLSVTAAMVSAVLGRRWRLRL